MKLIGRELRGIRLIRLIGSGGMGMVYLGKVVRASRVNTADPVRPAPDRGLSVGSDRGLSVGSEVAVKILHSHLARDPGLRSRFMREAGIGLTFRHPGIVRIYHVGSQRVGDEILYFLVMEYLRGITLRAVLDESGSLSDEVLRRIGRQLAGALGAIHGRGIIHRDLKPENIFLERRNVVKIGDFGLSQLARMSSDSMHRGFMGSVAYASPERFGPQRAKPSSDIYSLGVVLYEMAVGHNPFLKGDLAATIAAHLDETPETPADTGALISPFLSRFIMALLKKDPQKRLAPPSRLERILMKGESSAWWKSTEPEGLSGIISRNRAPFNVHRKTGFFGRSREVGELLDLLGKVGARKGGRVAVIRGEAGVGKTRLLDRLFEVVDLSGREGRLVMVPGLRSEVQAPYTALIHAALMALDISEANRKELRHRLGAQVREIFKESERDAAAFTDLLVSHLPEEGERAGMPPDPAAHLFADFFTRLAGMNLLILVVEDIQGTGPATRDVLLEMARHIGDARILMILTMRSGESFQDGGEESDEMGRFLEEIGALGGTHLIELGRLDRNDVDGILIDLGFPEQAVRGDVGERIFENTEGNPYFVLEVARLLLDEGVLNEENPDWFKLLGHIPSTVQDVFYRRLFKLSPKERWFLDFASVCGIRFYIDEVLAALDMDLAAAALIVSRLQNNLSLIRPTVGGMHRFDHVLIREMIYENLDGEKKRLFHRRFAAYVESRSGAQPLTGRDALKAAVHFSRGGDHAGALRHFFPACDYLLFKGGHERAYVLAREAVLSVQTIRRAGNSLDAGTECRVYLRQAFLAAHLGRRESEFPALKRASAAAAGSSELRPFVSLRLGQYYLATSRFISALHCAGAALGGMRRLKDRDGEALALQTMADIMRNTEGSLDAIGHLRAALQIRQDLKDTSGLARIQTDMGLLFLEQGEIDQAGDAFKEARRIFRTIRDDEGTATILLGLSRFHREKGRVDLAENSLRRATALARRLGQRFLLGRILTDLGECFLAAGRFEEAEENLLEARRMAGETKNRKILVRVLAALARLHSHPGTPVCDEGRALREAREALAVEQEAQLAVRDRIAALNALALVFLRKGKSRSALAITRKTVRLLAATPGRTLLERETRRLHAAARIGSDEDPAL